MLPIFLRLLFFKMDYWPCAKASEWIYCCCGSVNRYINLTETVNLIYLQKGRKSWFAYSKRAIGSILPERYYHEPWYCEMGGQFISSNHSFLFARCSFTAWLTGAEHPARWMMLNWTLCHQHSWHVLKPFSNYPSVFLWIPPKLNSEFQTLQKSKGEVCLLPNHATLHRLATNLILLEL